MRSSGASPVSGADLLALPVDLLECVLARCAPACILGGVAPCCRALSAAADAESLWAALLAARYECLLRTLFSGRCPAPPHGVSWREHYFAFATTFLQHARRAGLAVLVIDGVVYDVTHYIDSHP